MGVRAASCSIRRPQTRWCSTSVRRCSGVRTCPLVVQRGDLARRGPVAAEFVEVADPLGFGEVAAADEDAAQRLRLRLQVAAERQAALHELVGGGDVLPLLRAAGAVEALANSVRRRGLAGSSCSATAKLSLALSRLRAHERAGHLQVQPAFARRYRNEGGEHLCRVVAPAETPQEDHLRLQDVAHRPHGPHGPLQRRQRFLAATASSSTAASSRHAIGCLGSRCRDASKRAIALSKSPASRSAVPSRR